MEQRQKRMRSPNLYMYQKKRDAMTPVLSTKVQIRLPDLPQLSGIQTSKYF